MTHRGPTPRRPRALLIVETPSGIVALEIKAAERWDRKFGAGLSRIREHHKQANVKLFGVYAGERPLVEEGVRVLPWKAFVRQLWEGKLLEAQ